MSVGARRADFQAPPRYNEPETPRLKEALKLANAGFPVFPLVPGGKVPFSGSRGYLDATTNPDQIRRWFAMFPDCNYGVLTGEEVGVFVIDVDLGKGGFKTLKALEKKHGKLPNTVMVLTGGGGKHYFFRCPPGQKVRSGKLGEGIDIQSKGRYVVGAGSKTKEEYQWAWDRSPDEMEIAEAPEWLLREVTGPPKPRHLEPVPGRQAASGVHYTGERNVATRDYICTLRLRHGSHEEAMVLAKHYAHARCKPPPCDREVERTVHSIYRPEYSNLDRREWTDLELLVIAASYEIPEVWPATNRIFRFLLRQQASTGACFHSYATLAREAGCCPRHAMRAVKQLKERGLYVKHRRKRDGSWLNDTNRYDVLALLEALTVDGDLDVTLLLTSSPVLESKEPRLCDTGGGSVFRTDDEIVSSEMDRSPEAHEPRLEPVPTPKPQEPPEDPGPVSRTVDRDPDQREGETSETEGRGVIRTDDEIVSSSGVSESPEAHEPRPEPVPTRKHLETPAVDAGGQVDREAGLRRVRALRESLEVKQRMKQCDPGSGEYRDLKQECERLECILNGARAPNV